jgi:hypothetical protein
MSFRYANSNADPILLTALLAVGLTVSLSLPRLLSAQGGGAQVTLHVVNPLPGGGNLPGVSVTMTAGTVEQKGTTGTTGQFTGRGFSVGDEVKIVYELAGFVSRPTRTSAVAQAATVVEGNLVPSTMTQDLAKIFGDWINQVALKANPNAKRDVYIREWMRVQELDPELQQVIGTTLSKGPAVGYLQTDPTVRKAAGIP